jgi:L-rhamnose mutarotase
MACRAYIGKIRKGKENEYIEAHKAVWPDLLTAMKKVGVEKEICFVRGNYIFVYVESSDIDAAMQALSADPVNQRWDAYMESVKNKRRVAPGDLYWDWFHNPKHSCQDIPVPLVLSSSGREHLPRRGRGLRSDGPASFFPRTYFFSLGFRSLNRVADRAAGVTLTLCSISMETLMNSLPKDSWSLPVVGPGSPRSIPPRRGPAAPLSKDRSESYCP